MLLPVPSCCLGPRCLLLAPECWQLLGECVWGGSRPRIDRFATGAGRGSASCTGAGAGAGAGACAAHSTRRSTHFAAQTTARTMGSGNGRGGAREIRNNGRDLYGPPYNNYRRQASNAAKRQRVRAWEQTAAGAVVGAGKAAAAAALTPEEEVLSPLCCRTALALLPHSRRGGRLTKRERASIKALVPW